MFVPNLMLTLSARYALVFPYFVIQLQNLCLVIGGDCLCVRLCANILRVLGPFMSHYL